MRYSLQIDQRPAFQASNARWQRIGWMLMAACVAAGCLGLFGNGWVSQASARNQGGTLQVDYERFARAGERSTLTFHLNAANAATIHIGQEYLDDVRIDAILPTPTRVISDAAGVIFSFDQIDKRSTTRIRFHVMPLRAKTGSLMIRSAHGDTLRLRQLVYP